MAGLLLCAELLKLQKGTLVGMPQNITAVELSTVRPIVQRKIRSADKAAASGGPAELRQRIAALAAPRRRKRGSAV